MIRKSSTSSCHQEWFRELILNDCGASEEHSLLWHERDQGNFVSVESNTQEEVELLPPTTPFKRSLILRGSLPIRVEPSRSGVLLPVERRV